MVGVEVGERALEWRVDLRRRMVSVRIGTFLTLVGDRRVSSCVLRAAPRSLERKPEPLSELLGRIPNLATLRDHDEIDHVSAAVAGGEALPDVASRIDVERTRSRPSSMEGARADEFVTLFGQPLEIAIPSENISDRYGSLDSLEVQPA
jgi:hypothetical protein